MDCKIPVAATQTLNEGVAKPSYASLSTRSSNSENDHGSAPGKRGSTDMDGLYDLLVGTHPASGIQAILYGWWPKPAKWTWPELVERCTRCLPAVRPLVDLVALPDLPEVHDIWETWSKTHALEPEQAIWFAPHLEDTIQDAASVVCRSVLSSPQVAKAQLGHLHFYPMYMTKTITAEAVAQGLPVIGDAEDNIVAPLSSAKAWLHPRIADDGSVCTSSLRDVLPPLPRGVRGPRGYVATSLASLQEAWKRLQAESPSGTRFVLKPSSGSGGSGVILNAKWEELSSFDFSDAGSSAILEEFVVSGKPTQSPTLYMLGDSPCGRLADQVLLEDGVTNIGNKYPSNLRTDMLTVCTLAAQKLNKVWGLTSNWGLDFVIDADGTPIIVDLNMGRPNGNFAVRLWASRQKQTLSIFTGSYRPPSSEGFSIGELMTELQKEKLLWDGTEGAIVYQHIPGFESGFAIASSLGEKAIDSLLCRFAKILKERFGVQMSWNL
eukprot:TRINITY_DN34482_c0_g1_i1.p1 TRINITY_DN34482_c0_g1~~TRINITY_DN34482_c0_g1_i1.p1  ORF type:complete len:493 (+),score=93.47 TRINITY_DN34482_c0_g1_i1:62-1540(+)